MNKNRLGSGTHEKDHDGGDEDDSQMERSSSSWLKPKNKIKYEEIPHHHTVNKESLPTNQALHGSLFKIGNVFPRSDLFFSEGLKFIISCQKKSCCFGSTFHLSSSRDHPH